MDSDSVPQSPEAKKPCKGILKSSSSFDKQSVASSQRRKSTKFDELNVLQTYHPADKDYGHMKIEEPKTPYNYANPDERETDQLDARELAERLSEADRRESFEEYDELSRDSDDMTVEETHRRLAFVLARTKHYNEYKAVGYARKLIEEEDDDDEDNASGVDKEGASKTAEDSEAGSSSSSSGNEQSTSQSTDLHTADVNS